MDTKSCNKCGEVKSFDAFSKDKSKKDGLRTTCSSCDAVYRAANKDQRAEAKRKWEDRNKDQRAESKKSRYISNKASAKEYNAAYYSTNRDAIKRRSNEWRKENPAAALSRTRRYQASKLQRTPQWADMSAIADFYVEAKRMEELTGIKFHVDHIVPLQGGLVSGLHVEGNLQLLPEYENLSKSNSFDPQTFCA